MKILSTNRRLLIISKINLEQTPESTPRKPFPNAASWMDTIASKTLFLTPQKSRG